MGDQFGRKRVFLFGVVFFTVASVACGVATSPGMLIAGRALQGIGAAFLVPGSLAIISATFDDAERGRAIGTWSGFSAMTTAIGPVSGGWLVEHVSWRAVFFLNVPLAIIVLVLSLRFMNESHDPSRTTQIDWSGAALAVLGLGSTVFGLLEWPPLGARHRAGAMSTSSRRSRARRTSGRPARPSWTGDWSCRAPSRPRRKKRWPLIFFLHGIGERGSDPWKVKVHGPPKVAEKMSNFPFVVVSPQCPDGQWWSSETLIALLHHSLQQFRTCHPRRSFMRT